MSSENKPPFLAQQQAEKQPNAPAEVGVEEPQHPIITTVETLDPSSMIKEEDWAINATQLMNWANNSHKNAAKRN